MKKTVWQYEPLTFTRSVVGREPQEYPSASELTGALPVVRKNLPAMSGWPIMLTTLLEREVSICKGPTRLAGPM